MKVVVLYLKIILLTILVSIICYSVLYMNPEYNIHYAAGIKPKYEKLKKIESNKIVIVGGSNGNFGINSEQIENRLKTPTVNMALMAGIPPKFYLEYVKNDLKEGDILIITPEYGALHKDNWTRIEGVGSPLIITYTPSKTGVLFKDINLLKNNILGLSKIVKSYWERFPIEKDISRIGLYDLRAYKSDNIDGHYLKGEFSKEVKRDHLTMNDDLVYFNELKEFINYFNKNGIQVYLSPPSVIDEKILASEAQDYMEILSEKSNIPMLGVTKPYIMKREYFLNTFYHLNDKGRELRTDLLINDLLTQKVMKDSLIIQHFNKHIMLIKDKSEKLKLSELVKQRLNFVVDRSNLKNEIPVSIVFDEKVQFIRTKLEEKKYKNHLFELKVEASREVIDAIKFKNVGVSSFDKIKELPNNEYLLYKKLNNNVKIHDEKGNTYLGVNIDKTKRLKGSTFIIKQARLLGEEFDYETIDNYNFSKAFKIPNNVKSLLFNLKGFDNGELHIKDILNIDSNEALTNEKYLIKIDEAISVFEFYSGKLIYKKEIKSNSFNLEFINSINGFIEIIY